MLPIRVLVPLLLVLPLGSAGRPHIPDNLLGSHPIRDPARPNHFEFSSATDSGKRSASPSPLSLEYSVDLLSNVHNIDEEQSVTGLSCSSLSSLVIEVSDDTEVRSWGASIEDIFSNASIHVALEEPPRAARRSDWTSDDTAMEWNKTRNTGKIITSTEYHVGRIEISTDAPTRSTVVVPLASKELTEILWIGGSFDLKFSMKTTAEITLSVPLPPSLGLRMYL
eukprot:m51a1_g4874 hypothetical protein (224) ;mRNA; r:375246-376537